MKVTYWKVEVENWRCDEQPMRFTTKREAKAFMLEHSQFDKITKIILEYSNAFDLLDKMTSDPDYYEYHGKQ